MLKYLKDAGMLLKNEASEGGEVYESITVLLRKRKRKLAANRIGKN